MKCKKPVLLTLYVTERCQAKCSFCNIWKKENPRDADPGLFKGILEEHLLLPENFVERQVFPDSATAGPIRDIVRA